MLPYIIMDLPIFVIAEWATLLVDICCPRGGSQLSIPIHFSGLAALIVLILHETYDHWSVAVLTVTVHSSFFPTFDFFLNMLLSALDSIC